jgi:hypothetical protein
MTHERLPQQPADHNVYTLGSMESQTTNIRQYSSYSHNLNCFQTVEGSNKIPDSVHDYNWCTWKQSCFPIPPKPRGELSQLIFNEQEPDPKFLPGHAILVEGSNTFCYQTMFIPVWLVMSYWVSIAAIFCIALVFIVGIAMDIAGLPRGIANYLFRFITRVFVVPWVHFFTHQFLWIYLPSGCRGCDILSHGCSEYGQPPWTGNRLGHPDFPATEMEGGKSRRDGKLILLGAAVEGGR